jgi:hypothetical protein
MVTRTYFIIGNCKIKTSYNAYSAGLGEPPYSLSVWCPDLRTSADSDELYARVTTHMTTSELQQHMDHEITRLEEMRGAMIARETCAGAAYDRLVASLQPKSSADVRDDIAKRIIARLEDRKAIHVRVKTAINIISEELL